VLPLILGIGVDAGVHLMERVRQSELEHGMARLDDVLLGTGASVALASTTTLAGFAALMLADYGAMQSLGRVMSLGMVSCMLASLIALPALLVAMKRAH
jgi:predicted RND superfamily exporter protein